MRYKPTREEVETFLQALNYGMKVECKKDFMIALAEAWLNMDSNKVDKVLDTPPPDAGSCEHYFCAEVPDNRSMCLCLTCGAEIPAYRCK